MQRRILPVLLATPLLMSIARTEIKAQAPAADYAVHGRIAVGMCFRPSNPWNPLDG